jgi:hypothetical protein
MGLTGIEMKSIGFAKARGSVRALPASTALVTLIAARGLTTLAWAAGGASRQNDLCPE